MKGYGTLVTDIRLGLILDLSQRARHLQHSSKMTPCQNPAQNGRGTEGTCLVTGVWRPGMLVLHFGAILGRQGQASSCRFTRITEGQRKGNGRTTSPCHENLRAGSFFTINFTRITEGKRNGNGRDPKCETYPMHS